jgi:tellurite resistance protein TerC
VLVAVEGTDIVFAVDSIPAIFSITLDPFIVYTSNIFAILGLRSLYFALAGMMDKFRHLKYGLALVLAFVGVKMLLSTYYPIPIGISLAVVVGVLTLSILASLVLPAPKPAPGEHLPPPPDQALPGAGPPADLIKPDHPAARGPG